MKTTQHLSCSCGKTQWSLSATQPGRHIICYCKDCQAAPRHLGQSQIMDDNGGTHIWQTVPTTLDFTSSPDIACIRLSPKGLLRWYAACCGTPIANTLPKPGFPFLGAILPTPAEGFGPVRGWVNVSATHGKVKQKGQESAIATLIGRAIGAFVQQKTRNTFFTDAGQPIIAPKVLTLAERSAAQTQGQPQ